VGVRGASPPEADGILVLEHTFLRCPGACSGMTEAIRQRRTFDTAAVLSVNGAGVSHLEVLCDFLQVQSFDRCVFLVLCSLNYGELI